MMVKKWRKAGIVLMASALMMVSVQGVSAKPSPAKPPVSSENELPLSPTYDLEKLFTLFEPGFMNDHFKSMDTILPYNEILNAGGKKVHKFKEKTQDFSKLTYKYEGKKYSLSDLHEKTDTNGMLVLKDGKIISESYFNGYNAYSKATSWSVAKSFLSILVGIAVDEKKIKSINDQVTKYVPELIGTGYEGVTVKQVLEMSSGVQFNEDYADPNSDVNVLIPYLFFENGSIDDYVTSLVREDAPGSHKYKSIDTQVVGLILKKATGVPVSQYLQEKLWKPLEMENKAFWGKELQGNEVTFAMLNATLRDYAKFGELVLNDGKYEGKKIVSKKWIKESVTPSRPELYPGKADPYFGYGYQWWIPQGAKYGEEFTAIGIYGQYIYVNKKEDVVIVKNSSDPGIIVNDAETIEAFRAIAKAAK